MVFGTKKLEVKAWLFFVSYSIYMITALLSQTFYYQYFVAVHKVIIVFCLLLLVLKETQEETFKVNSLWGIMVCCILFAITLKSSSGAIQNTIPLMIAYIASAKKLEFRKIAKVSLIVSAVVLVFTIVSAYFGFISDYTVYSNSLSRVRLRHYLGFRYALYPTTILFNINCLYIFLKKEKIRIWNIMLLLAVDFWMYLQTDSRMTFLLSVAICVIGLFLKGAKWMNRRRGKVSLLGAFCFPLFFSLSLFITLQYNHPNPTVLKLNLLLGNRLRLGYISLRENGVSLMGNPIHWVGAGFDAFGNKTLETYSYVDSFYIQILQHYGVLLTVVLLFVLTRLMLRLRRADIYLYIILLLISAHFVIDDLQLYLHYNTFWLVAGYQMGCQFLPDIPRNEYSGLRYTSIQVVGNHRSGE